jgi:hypothetical protein
MQPLNTQPITHQDFVNKITKLNKEWYKLISAEHHKDRDCHWCITTRWSYGKRPSYTVEHHGYIGDDINTTFTKYEDALNFLVIELERAIATELYNQQHR